MLRKLEPGLVAMYSRSSVLMTSTMKSLPGRSMTMSPVAGLPFCGLPPSDGFAGASCFAASGDCAPTVAAAVAPTPAAADFRKSRLSMALLSSSSFQSSLSLAFVPGTSFYIEEHARKTHAARRRGGGSREGWNDRRDGGVHPPHSLRGGTRGDPAAAAGPAAGAHD